VFGGDESHLVHMLGAYCGLALERCSLLHEERRMSERLQELDVVKDALMTAASHDVRTPLTTMVGFANTLRDHADSLDPASREKFLGLIAEGGEQVEHVLDDLLGHARRNRETGSVDLRELVDRVVARLGLQRAQVAVGGEHVRAACDSLLTERMVENLLVNADRHGGDAPTVRVEVGVEDHMAKLCVDDDGPGVPADLRERIFEPEERGLAGDDVPGSGLGLSIVRRFAIVQGGRVWVEDSPSGGARFCVTLPLEQA
jgi:signal transduction histidine kinase